MTSEARERLLDEAEKLFSVKGYNAVTLRDIAGEVGIKHASIYHHAPGGKEQLFIEVTERNLHRHQEGLAEAIKQSAPDVCSKMQAIAHWLLSQPPMDLIRMVHSDMPAIDKEEALRLSQMAFDAMFRPVEAVLRDAQERGEVRHPNIGIVAGGFVGMVESLHAIPEYAVPTTREALADELIDVWLDGLRV